MEFNECLFTRRSIRNFTDEKISNDIIKDIINAGIYAPNACNFEAWKFIIIDKDNKNKEKLENPIISRAPYGIIVTYRNDIFVTGRKYNDYYQSASAAIQNMLLYINSIGLGAVWICNLPKQSIIKKQFNIPKKFDVISYIAFGHPLKEHENSIDEMVYHYGDVKSFEEHRRKYSLEQVMCYNEFESKKDDCTYAKFPTKKKLAITLFKKKIKRIIRKFKGK